MKVIPLGISSGRPTLTRGLSSVAVVLDGLFVLLDCGEGTQWQLVRAGLRPTSRLDAVFITHLHGDHLTGLPGLLGTMTLEGRSAPVTITGPKGIAEYLEQMRRLSLVRPQFELEVREIEEPGEVHRGPGYRVSCDAMRHRVTAFGYRIEEEERPGRFDAEKATALGVFGPLRGQLIRGESVTTPDGRRIDHAAVVGPARRGLRLAYCTDTAFPCEGVVRLATGVDLMIHEATYTRDHLDEALQRGHSTAAQAAEAAQKAGAARLVITHFSPRYDDLQPLLDEARAVYPDTTLAQELVPIELVPPA